MILSHRHRFIFIKTRKTAGTSVEIALSKHCGPDDIITRIAPDDEAVRQELGYRGPQHWQRPWYQYRPSHLRKLVRKRKIAALYWNHVSAATILQTIDKSVWNSCFKFCFERNPWDKVVSYYQYHKGHNRNYPPTLERFFSLGMEGLASSHNLYTLDGAVAVDEVARFENLEDDFARIAKRLGLPDVPELPRTKAGFRKDRRPLDEVLTPAMRDRIGEVFAPEIELFGYTFEDALERSRRKAGA